jgi:hypothetical protein
VDIDEYKTPMSLPHVQESTTKDLLIDSASHLFKNLGLPIWAEFCIGPQQMDNRFFAFVSVLS